MALTRLRRQSAHARRALACEIAETLYRLGGAAHRDRVMELMAAARRSRGKAVDERLRLHAVEAFDAYCDLGRRGGEVAPLFTLPFGPDSHRWALLDEAARLGAAGAVVIPAELTAH